MRDPRPSPLPGGSRIASGVESRVIVAFGRIPDVLWPSSVLSDTRPFRLRSSFHEIEIVVHLGVTCRADACRLDQLCLAADPVQLSGRFARRGWIRMTYWSLSDAGIENLD